MFDYSMLPTSNAEKMIEPTVVDDKIKYTYMENSDEGKLYKDLCSRLMKLETSMTIDKEVLQTIIDDANGFRFLMDDKEEVLIRIGWLERLHKVQQELSNLQTKEQALKLKKLLTVCQTSPLKNHLTTQLNQLAQTLSAGQNVPVQMTDEEILMNKVFEDAGRDFINLGKAGRDAVIAKVIKQSGKKATIEAVHERTKALECRVEALTAIKESKELVKQLDSLPIPSFHSLPVERKGRIAETLIENNKWNGLASLDRMIAHFDKAITKEEQQQEEAKKAILTSDGTAALTLDIQHVEDGRIQLG